MKRILFKLFTWHNLPVVKHREGECLALRVRPQIGFEAERVDGRNKRLDGVQRGARYRRILEKYVLF
jgi:hypothetical protein